MAKDKTILIAYDCGHGTVRVNRRQYERDRKRTGKGYLCPTCIRAYLAALPPPTVRLYDLYERKYQED